MLTVICVCKQGKYRNRDYTAEWVLRLKNLVKSCLTLEHTFVCLSDIQMEIKGVQVIPLLHNWEAWWSKIELFRRDLPGDRFLYLDLDSIPVRDLDSLVQSKGSFIAINKNEVSSKQKNIKRRKKKLASGVMVWDKEYANVIYDLFCKETIKELPGDQDWIEFVLKAEDIPFTSFSKNSIQLLRDVGSESNSISKDCKVICCSPNGWRQDLVVEYKGKQYTWVEKVWKGKLKLC